MSLRAVLAALAILIAGPAQTWDDQGHMMVAAVAFDRLTPATKARVAKLLKLNRYPTNGTNDAVRADKAKATFMLAATSADAIKADRADYTDDGEDPTRVAGAASNLALQLR